MPKIFIVFVLFFIIIGNNARAQKQTLDYYIDTGLNNSPLLKDLNNRIISAGLDSLLIKAGAKPQLNISSQAMYAPVSNNFGYDSAITNGGNYSALLSVSQPLLNSQSKKARYQSVSILSQSLLTETKITITDLKKNITSLYLSAFTDYSQVQFYQSQVSLLKEQESVIKVLVEKGIYLQTDFLSLNLTIKSQEINVKQSFIQFKNDLGLLNYICGISDTSTVSLQDPDLVLQNDFNINNSPLFMQFKVDSLKNINDRLLIDVNYKPKLNAFADAGFNAINPKNIPDHFGASVGLNFILPVYDGKQRKLQYNKISLAESSRTSQLDFYTKIFDQQRMQLTEQLKLNDGIISDMKEQISDQVKLIKLYKLEMEKGLVRFMDILVVLNYYYNTSNNLLQKELEKMQIINQMNYLK